MNKSTAPVNIKLGEFLNGILESKKKNAKCWYRSLPKLQRDSIPNHILKSQFILGK